MGWALTALHWSAFFLEIIFATVCIASGLFYITNIIEEYTQISKSVFTWSNIGVGVTFVLLYLFEDTGLLNVACGLATCALAYLVIKQFPDIDMVSPQFIGLVVLMIMNHATAYFFFKERYLSFSQIIGYFTVCVWLVPIQLILGLVAGENILPTTGSGGRSNY